MLINHYPFFGWNEAIDQRLLLCLRRVGSILKQLVLELGENKYSVVPEFGENK
jgi:hypothetical protein